jgi:hypothetical protein
MVRCCEILIILEIGHQPLGKGLNSEDSESGTSVPTKTDNQGALALVSNAESHNRSKHIDTQQYWIRERLGAKKVRRHGRSGGRCFRQATSVRERGEVSRDAGTERDLELVGARSSGN